MTAARRAPRVLRRGFYRRPTLDVARDLLGLVLAHETADGVASGTIVEAEAYIGEDDPACHAAPGPTPRNAPMYGEPGHAYVYLNYGMHHLVNVVTEPRGVPAAVLIRALEPLDGVDLMMRRRGESRGGKAPARVDLCKGPGNLTRALGISLAQNRADLTSATPDQAAHSRRIWIEDRGIVPGRIEWGPRVGIRVGLDRDWRCAIAGHPCLSRSTRL